MPWTSVIACVRYVQLCPSTIAFAHTCLCSYAPVVDYVLTLASMCVRANQGSCGMVNGMVWQTIASCVISYAVRQCGSQKIVPNTVYGARCKFPNVVLTDTPGTDTLADFLLEAEREGMNLTVNLISEFLVRLKGPDSTNRDHRGFFLFKLSKACPLSR
jgi:hypothetical protein